MFLELWTSHSSHHFLSAALPWQVDSPWEQAGVCLPCPRAAGGLCPCSGHLALLGAQQVRTPGCHTCLPLQVQGAPGWPRTRLGKRVLLRFKPSFWLGLVLACCCLAAGAGSCPSSARLRVDCCCPSWTDTFPGPTRIHFSRKCCFWHLASPRAEFLLCLQAG